MKDCELIFTSMNLGVGLVSCNKNKISIEFFNEEPKLEYRYLIKK